MNLTLGTIACAQSFANSTEHLKISFSRQWTIYNLAMASFGSPSKQPV